jgi:hypothetical protein
VVHAFTVTLVDFVFHRSLFESLVKLTATMISFVKAMGYKDYWERASQVN